MKTENTTGQTETTNVINEPCNNCWEPRHLGTVREIFDSSYDEEIDTCFFDLELYNGDMVTIGLKASQIKEIGLFHKKEMANMTYVKHLMRN